MHERQHTRVLKHTETHCSLSFPLRGRSVQPRQVFPDCTSLCVFVSVLMKSREQKDLL